MGGKIKERLDVLLVKKGFFESREKARRFIMAGKVMVNGSVVDKPGTRVDVESDIRLKEPPKYVSRGGYKIESAWKVLRFDVSGKVACDIGASTGGFTDFLLQRGAKKVYAVDVGRGQLHWKLRNDPKVVVLEKVNARYLEPEILGEKVDFVTCDVSFISLKKISHSIRKILKDDGEALVLIKPQFEAGREKVVGGIVKDGKVHVEVLRSVLEHFKKEGFKIKGVVHSGIKGAEGNIEYFALLSFKGEDVEVDLEKVVEKAFEDLEG